MRIKRISAKAQCENLTWREEVGNPAPSRPPGAAPAGTAPHWAWGHRGRWGGCLPRARPAGTRGVWGLAIPLAQGLRRGGRAPPPTAASPPSRDVFQQHQPPDRALTCQGPVMRTHAMPHIPGGSHTPGGLCPPPQPWPRHMALVSSAPRPRNRLLIGPGS